MKKRWIYTIIVSSALVVGITSGALVKYFGTSENVIYEESFASELKVDYDKVYEKVSSYDGEKNLFDVFSVSDVINYSMEKYIRCENCYSFKYGTAINSFVNQEIRCAQIKNGNEYFEESISKSDRVSCGNRTFQTNRKGDVDLYTADPDSIVITDTQVSAEYGDKQTFTSDEIVKKCGKPLDETLFYIISERTIKKSDVSSKEDGYVVVLTLDADLSTYFHKLQMQSISNLEKLPVFSSVAITFELDNDFYPTHMFVNEDYVATLVMEARTHSELEVFFYPNQIIDIPDLQEPLNYKK